VQMKRRGGRYRGPVMKGKPLAYGIWYVLLPHAEKKFLEKTSKSAKPAEKDYRGYPNIHQIYW